MNPVLTDLGEPRQQLVRGQGRESGEIAQHPGRRVERADEVLALVGVEAGLAADRRVDHGEQRRRHLHDPDAAQPGRRDEPREVGDRSPADPDDGVAAGETGLPEKLPASRRDRRGLAGLGVRDLGRDGLEPGVGQAAPDRLAQPAERTASGRRAPGVRR